MKFLAVLALFFAPFVAFAQVLPSPLVPQCSGASGFGFFEGACTFCDLAKLFNNVVQFAVGFSVIAATLMLVYAGILYFSAAGSGQEQIKKAHKIFTQVTIGIIFVMAAWLIVDLVVKTLTQGKIGPWNKIQCGEYPAIVIPPLAGTPSVDPSGSDAACTGTGCLSNDEAYLLLVREGIPVTSSGNCTDRNNSACTSLEGMQESTLVDLIDLKDQLGYPLTVTAGTETGHSHRCHPSGECLDFAAPASVIGGPGNFNVGNINHIIEEAGTIGRCPVFEPPSGIPCPVGVMRCEEVPWSTGAHFSFYNC